MGEAQITVFLELDVDLRFSQERGDNLRPYPVDIQVDRIKGAKGPIPEWLSKEIVLGAEDAAAWHRDQRFMACGR